jgi:hypothetical protein
VTPATRAGAWVLALAFLALHLPSLPASLEDVDSINFALGVRDFDVARHQPHPPGYPLFILAAKAVNVVVPNEAHALGLINIVSGALAVLALARLFGAARALPETFALAAALLTVAAPLFWVTAARPLSDVAGLAAAVGVQARLARASHVRGLTVAAGWAGLAAGIRSQVVWLTVPLLVVAWLRIERVERWHAGAVAAAAYAAGVALWTIPLVIFSGGPAAYWQALFNQGAEDLSGVTMLWTTPTPRQAALTLYYAFVAPWGAWPLAAIVLTLALAGVVRLLRRERDTLAALAAAFGPYAAFDLLFQEAVTTRYALPLVVPVAFLAVRGAAVLPAPAAITLVVATAAAGLMIGQATVYAYSRSEAPAFRLLADMAAEEQRRPVLAMHRRQEFDLRRPMLWRAAELPATAGRLPSPPRREWLELVKYWNGGGRDPVWFIADPLRSDLALVDHGPPVQTYRWPLEYPLLIGGVRPNVMDWYKLERPAWYVGEGWSLTPETAGVARQTGKGPAAAPIEAWISLQPPYSNLMYGGRNFAAAPGRVTVSVDGRVVDEIEVAPGFFLRMLKVPADGDATEAYSRLTITADTDVAIEQFNSQVPHRVLFGFGAGWHEHEYNPSTGRLWRWTSDRAVLRVRSAGRPLALTLAGETDRLPRESRVRVRAGDRVIAEVSVGRQFAVRATIPAELLRGEESVITIETDQTYVPAETQWGSQDRRRLGLQIFECRLTPVS